MHIAVFCHNYVPHPGGVEVVVDELAKELGQRHRLTIVTSDWEGVHGVTRSGNVVTWRVPACHLSERAGIPYPIPYGMSLNMALHDASTADVFHAHGALYVHTMLAARLAQRSGRPLVLTEHVGLVEYRSTTINAIQRAAWTLVGDRTMRQTSAVTACSTRVQAWLSARYPQHLIRFVANGVNLARFARCGPDARRLARDRLGLPVDGIVVLFVGRATSKKNIEHVLSIPRADFTLVTCGAQRNILTPGVADLGNVAHEQMPSVYASADIMVHAAVGEGFPLAVQEAMASAVPVVLRWDHGYGGTLDRSTVLACDSREEIANATRRLVDSPSLRESMGRTGEQWARNSWSWSKAAREFEAIYRDVRGDTDVA